MDSGQTFDSLRESLGGSDARRKRWLSAGAERMRLRRESGARGAEEGLDLGRGAGGGEQVALANAAAGIGEEVTLRVVLDALGDHLEAEAAGEGDQGTRERGVLVIVRQARDQAAVDA